MDLCSNIKTNPGSQLALFVRVFSSYYWKILSYAYNVYILHWISWIPSLKVILIFCHHGYAIQTACVYSCWPSPPSPCNCLQRLGERGKISQFGIYFSFLQMPPNLFIILIVKFIELQTFLDNLHTQDGSLLSYCDILHTFIAVFVIHIVINQIEVDQTR